MKLSEVDKTDVNVKVLLEKLCKEKKCGYNAFFHSNLMKISHHLQAHT